MDDINKETYKYRMDPSGSLHKFETINSKNYPFQSNAHFNQPPQRLSGAQRRKLQKQFNNQSNVRSNYLENPFRTSTESSAERGYADQTGSQRNFDHDNRATLKQHLDYDKSQGTFGVEINKYRKRSIEKNCTEINPYDPYGNDEMGPTKSYSHYDKSERYNQKRNAHNPDPVVEQNLYQSRYLIDKKYEEMSTRNSFSKNANVDPYADVDSYADVNPYADVDPYADIDPYGYIKMTSATEKSQTSNQSISYFTSPQRRDENESYTGSDSYVDDDNIARYSTNYEYDRSPRHRSSSNERNYTDRDSCPRHRSSSNERNYTDRDSYRYPTDSGLNFEEDRRESRYEFLIEDDEPSSSYKMQRSFSDYSESDYRRRRSPSVEKFGDKHYEDYRFRSRPPNIENVEISNKKISFTPQRQNPNPIQGKPYWNPKTKAGKPNNPYNKPENPSKQMKTAQPNESQVKLKLAVVNKHHPKIILSEEQANLIQNNLIQAIDNLKTRGEKIPHFDNTHYAFGALWVTCANEYSKNWLKQMINDFKSLPDGCELDINERLVPKQVFRPPRILVNLPIADKEKAVRRRLHIQNPKLNTENWVLVDTQIKRNIKTVTYHIDEQSYGILGECSFRPFYNFGRIRCRT